MNSDSDVTVNGEDTYRVEVSGWDAKENFFVEKTTLEWKPEDTARRFLDWFRTQGFGMIGLILAWYLFDRIFSVVFRFALDALYPGSHWG